MEFNGIPDAVLDQVIGETWGGEYTLRDSLKPVKDEILHHELSLYPDGKLKALIAWTAEDVLVLLDNPFGDRDVCSFPRNPPNIGGKP